MASKVHFTKNANDLEQFIPRDRLPKELEGDEDIIGDGVAFAGVSQYPARVKCALLGWKAFQAATADALNEVEK